MALEQVGLAQGELIASGAASISAGMTVSMSSMPSRSAGSPGMPWSTATSKQRPETGWKRRLRRYCFMGADPRPC